MNTNSGKNEGVRMLDEIICQAIPDPSVLAAIEKSQTATQGKDENELLSEESTCEESAERNQPEQDDTRP